MTEFPYGELAKLGIEKVVITYSGSGDEGYIDDISADGADVEFGELYDVLRDEVYDLLNDEDPGWEINDGSQGDITLMVAERKAYLHHGSNFIHTEYTDKEFS